MESSYNILRKSDFRAFVFSRFMMTLAIQIQMVGVFWQIYELKKSALSLGMIGFAEVVPAVGFALFAGQIVDRSEPKSWLIKSQLLSAIGAAVLCLISTDFLKLSMGAHVFLIYACVFIWGVARALMRSSTFSIFGRMLSKKDYVRGQAWSSGAWQMAAAGGPAVGGFTYAAFGPAVTYSISVVLLLLSILTVTRAIAPQKPEFSTHAQKENFIQSLFEGVRFVIKKPIVISALSLDLFAVLFGGGVALLPIFADRLGVGAEGLGWLRAAPFMGAFPCVLVLAHWPLGKNAGRLLLGCVFCFGLCWLGFALSNTFWISMLFLIASGAFDAVSVVLRASVVQLFTPDTMKGRVAAVNGIFISSSNELGAVESGIAAEVLGLTPAVIFGSFATLLVVLFVGWYSPELREFDLRNIEEEDKKNA